MATAGFNAPILKTVSITAGPVIDVAQYGAVGDGKKDDTAAIQSALNYIKAHGGTLNLQAGHTYIVSKSLVMSSADDFKIDGNGATIKMAAGAPVDSGHSILRLEGCDNFAVTELTLDGNRANRSVGAEIPAHNVLIRNSHDFSFSDVKAINAVADGFYLKAGDRAVPSTFTQDGLFLNCKADNSFRNGMTINNGENIQVIGGAYTNSHGTKPAAGIDVEADSGTATPAEHNILIRGVKLSGSEGFGVQLVAQGKPANITVENSTFSDNDRGAIKLGTSLTLIKANTFENSAHSERGLIDLPASTTNSYNVITGNSFNNITTGLPVIYAHMSSGTGNQVYSNKFYHISGPMLDSHTTGTKGWDNVITTSATYPTTSLDSMELTSSASADQTGTASADETVSTSAGSRTNSSTINGTSGDDQFVATATAEHFNGSDGTDSVSYANSPSAVTVKLWEGTAVGGHAAGDTFAGVERLIGSIYADRLEGTDGTNRLTGNDGNDVLLGLGGQDRILGGAGSDTLDGGSGDDQMHGQGGHDFLTGGIGLDKLYGGSGNDSISGDGDADQLYGEDGDDKLSGGAGADLLSGDLGADILQGGDGNDRLIGGQGNDRLIGEGGADTFVFDKPLSGHDVIQDFDAKADHVALVPNLNGNGINTAEQALAHVHADDKGNAVLDLGAGNSVTFQGVTPSQLGTDDFIVSNSTT